MFALFMHSNPSHGYTVTVSEALNARWGLYNHDEVNMAVVVQGQVVR